MLVLQQLQQFIPHVASKKLVHASGGRRPEPSCNTPGSCQLRTCSCRVMSVQHSTAASIRCCSCTAACCSLPSTWLQALFTLSSIAAAVVCSSDKRGHANSTWDDYLKINRKHQGTCLLGCACPVCLLNLHLLSCQCSTHQKSQPAAAAAAVL